MFKDQGECGDGKRLLVCDGCGISRCTEWGPEQIKHGCRGSVQQAQTPPTNGGLSDSELTELFPGEDPSLLGNRIKTLTSALGIPTCGGCERRRQWLNSAHEWVREHLN